MVALLTGCSDDDSAPDHGADGGSDRADGGPRMHHGDAAMPNASSQNDSGMSEQVDGAQPSCPAVQGIFNPVYTRLDGSCGAIDRPNPVPFDGGLHGVNTIIQRLAGASITTDIVLKGCNLHMTQKVADATGILQSQIDAPELSIESATRVTGRASVTQYDAAGALMCQGNYDAVFSKAMTALGVAH